ncbi:exported hypothetical protein [Vibrio crassostreae]|nr:exported hypothetical protein [Vibrio crassostreae]CAK3860426.1 exported hypothetical protein [Vibrio crassostreae]
MYKIILLLLLIASFAFVSNQDESFSFEDEVRIHYFVQNEERSHLSSIELIKADLNNDGTTEYLVTSPAFCGTGGCSYTIYAYSDFFERYGVAGSTNQSCYEWRNCFKEPIKGKIEPYGEKDFK